jgi:predicted membrane-bound spermidine synthase
MGRLKTLVPHAVVLATSMGVMIVELVASRLVAKYLGSSLFTWTSVIGIVLGGISLGNWVGGRLADRFSPRKLIPVLLLACSVLTALIVLLDLGLSRLTHMPGAGSMTASILARSVILIVILFFLPSAALGTVSPTMAKYALEREPRAGKAVGGIYAVGSLGSIAGTFLAGYVLIPALGLTTNILVVAAALALLSLVMGGRRIISGTWAVVLAAVALTGSPGALARSIIENDGTGRTLVHAADTPYSYLQVTDLPGPQGRERDLRLDALIHNKHLPDSPDTLLYEYERIYEALTREASPSSTLTLGGGAFTLPAFLERRYPAARHTVVEIDPGVVEAAFRWFDLPRASRIRIVVADARAFVDRTAGKESFDVIYCDAFNAFSVPAHLTTREFLRTVRRLLAPGGRLLVNCIDIFDSGRFLNAYVNTVRSVFPRVAVYESPGSTPSSRATFVVWAGEQEVGGSVLLGPEGTIVGVRVPEQRMAALHTQNGALVLTDDHAPVETLMAPVFLRAVE